MTQSMKVLGTTLMLSALLVTQTEAQEREKPRPQQPTHTQPTRPQPSRTPPLRAKPQRDVGDGHIPQSGPPRPGEPPRSADPAHDNMPSPPRPNYRDRPEHPAAPHVHSANDEWFGHGDARNDARYRLAQPWQHGRFIGAIGPRQVYRMHGGTHTRFNLGGYYFQVSPADWLFANDWFWNSDDIVLYDDEYNDGWYLAYNARTGTWVHVMYLGE